MSLSSEEDNPFSPYVSPTNSPLVELGPATRMISFARTDFIYRLEELLASMDERSAALPIRECPILRDHVDVVRLRAHRYMEYSVPRILTYEKETAAKNDIRLKEASDPWVVVQDLDDEQNDFYNGLYKGHTMAFLQVIRNCQGMLNEDLQDVEDVTSAGFSADLVEFSGVVTLMISTAKFLATSFEHLLAFSTENNINFGKVWHQVAGLHAFVSEVRYRMTGETDNRVNAYLRYQLSPPFQDSWNSWDEDFFGRLKEVMMESEKEFDFGLEEVPDELAVATEIMEEAAAGQRERDLDVSTDGDVLAARQLTDWETRRKRTPNKFIKWGGVPASASRVEGRLPLTAMERLASPLRAPVQDLYTCFGLLDDNLRSIKGHWWFNLMKNTNPLTDELLETAKKSYNTSIQKLNRAVNKGRITKGNLPAHYKNLHQTHLFIKTLLVNALNRTGKTSLEIYLKKDLHPSQGLIRKNLALPRMPPKEFKRSDTSGDVTGDTDVLAVPFSPDDPDQDDQDQAASDELDSVCGETLVDLVEIDDEQIEVQQVEPREEPVVVDLKESLRQSQYRGTEANKREAIERVHNELRVLGDCVSNADSYVRDEVETLPGPLAKMLSKWRTESLTLLGTDVKQDLEKAARDNNFMGELESKLTIVKARVNDALEDLDLLVIQFIQECQRIILSQLPIIASGDTDDLRRYLQSLSNEVHDVTIGRGAIRQKFSSIWSILKSSHRGLKELIYHTRGTVELTALEEYLGVLLVPPMEVRRRVSHENVRTPLSSPRNVQRLEEINYSPVQPAAQSTQTMILNVHSHGTKRKLSSPERYMKDVQNPGRKLSPPSTRSPSRPTISAQSSETTSSTSGPIGPNIPVVTLRQQTGSTQFVGPKVNITAKRPSPAVTTLRPSTRSVRPKVNLPIIRPAPVQVLKRPKEKVTEIRPTATVESQARQIVQKRLPAKGTFLTTAVPTTSRFTGARLDSGQVRHVVPRGTETRVPTILRPKVPAVPAKQRKMKPRLLQGPGTIGIVPARSNPSRRLFKALTGESSGISIDFV